MKHVFIILLALLLTAAFISCGGADKEPAPATISTTPAQANTPTQDQPTAAAPKPTNTPEPTIAPTMTPTTAPETQTQDQKPKTKELRLFQTPSPQPKSNAKEIPNQPKPDTNETATTEPPDTSLPDKHKQVYLLPLVIRQKGLGATMQDVNMDETWAFFVPTSSRGYPTPDSHYTQMMKDYWTELLGTEPQLLSNPHQPDFWNWYSYYTHSKETPLQVQQGDQKHSWPHALIMVGINKYDLNENLKTHIFKEGPEKIQLHVHTFLKQKGQDPEPIFTDQSLIANITMAKNPTIGNVILGPAAGFRWDFNALAIRFQDDTPPIFSFENASTTVIRDEYKFPRQIVILSWLVEPEP